MHFDRSRLTRKFADKALPPEPDTPAPFGYHVHIYFAPGEESEHAAKALGARAEAMAGENLNETIIYKRPVGPHIQANVAVHIKPEAFAEIVGWLQTHNTKGLSILIHPETGDELKDHMECSMWLGKQLEYNMKYFQPDIDARAAKNAPPKLN
jgi:DOPA 4,5-dioxygenase